MTRIPRDLLTTNEAAERIGMSPRFIRRLVAERRIAFHKFGRAVRIAPADIDAYVEATRVEPIDESDVWLDLRRVS